MSERRGVLFALVFTVYALTASYGSASIDVVAAEIPAWSLATRGDLNLQSLPLPDFPWFFEHAGGLYSDRFPGAIAYLVPGYWLADVVGQPDFAMTAGALTAAVVSASAVLVLREVYLLVLTTRRAAHVATLFTAFGTGAWSICANAPWSHTLDFLLLALALWALANDRQLWAGLAFGGVVLTRPQWLVALVVTALVLARLTRSIRPVVRVGLGMIPGVLLLVTYNGLVFDRWGPSNGHELGGNIAMRWGALPLNVLGGIFSPTRGVLFFYPIILVCLVALPKVIPTAGAWVRAAAVGGAVGILVQLLLNRYSGGDSFFGPRLWLETLVLWAPLAAVSVERYYADNPGSRAVPFAMAMGVAVHGIGAVLTPY